jgi:hypothetical protein
MRRHPIVPAHCTTARSIAISMPQQQSGFLSGMVSERLAGDLKLFGITYAAGFLFVSLFLY